MAAPHNAMGARPDEIVTRGATTNVGCAEKIGLSGKTRSAENACTP